MFDISRNLSSSSMIVRFVRYCWTLRDIMDCVTKATALVNSTLSTIKNLTDCVIRTCFSMILPPRTSF